MQEFQPATDHDNLSRLTGPALTELIQPEVLAFTQARGPDGGAGALIVLLDSSRSPDGRLR